MYIERENREIKSSIFENFNIILQSLIVAFTVKVQKNNTREITLNANTHTYPYTDNLLVTNNICFYLIDNGNFNLFKFDGKQRNYKATVIIINMKFYFIFVFFLQFILLLHVAITFSLNSVLPE